MNFRQKTKIVYARQFCHLVLLTGLIFILYSCYPGADIQYVIRQMDVTVDGKADEWAKIEGNHVDDPDQLWIGQDLVSENWMGKTDLSFLWKACWSGNKIFFLFEVKDDVLTEPATQPNSFLNDCIEIMLDPENIEGPRFTDTGHGKILHGYELHFLPAAPNHVFLNDSIAPMYPLCMAQDSLFKTKWMGEIACLKSKGGYTVEIGFVVPGLSLSPDLIVGMDVDVCDDDGAGRKSLMIWSGVNNEFWLSMDKYPKVAFK